MVKLPGRRLRSVRGVRNDTKPALHDYSEMLPESQICAQVLQHLALGSVPTDLSPSTPINATDDAKAYQQKTTVENRHLLAVALSILLDSTSPGPDPLALQSLGWAYGGGGGGGMGDWDGCHYMTGSVGATLRVLQDQVAADIIEKNPSLKDEVDAEAWWLKDHGIEYGKGKERSATRFCTVGGIAPRLKPYDKDGFVWGPPIAGLCVPSSCTADGLLSLFETTPGFADLLLDLSSENGIYDESTQGGSIPTASRRFRYMNSLSQSLMVGFASKMGIVCEGESGMKELDEEGFVSLGFIATMALICFLLACVLIGTVSSSLLQDDDSKCCNEDNETDRNVSSEERSLGTELRQHSGVVTNIFHSYGSVVGETDGSDKSHMLGLDESDQGSLNIISQPIEMKLSLKEEYPVKDDCGVLDTLVQSPCENDISPDECSNLSGELQDSNRYLKLLTCMRDKFAYFNANQSLYEITRMKSEHLDTNRMYEGKLREIGGISLDTASSQHGLIAVYKESKSLKRRSSKRTMSLSSSKCLNGMRSISMLWIIFGHTMAVQSSIGYVNPAAVLPPTGMMSSTLGSIILSARYAVDTFFFIGGYLVMSGLLKRLDPRVGNAPSEEEIAEVEWLESILSNWGFLSRKHIVFGDYIHRLQQNGRGQKQSKKFMWIPQFLLHRLLRILPTYGFVLLLWWKVAVYMGDGPFWPRWATFAAQCDAQWWTNLLFVNNIIPRIQPFGETSECMYHAWYLGVDFQLCAILAPIFVSLYLTEGCRKLTVLLEVTLITTIIIISYAFSIRYGWSAHLVDGADTVAFDRGFYINPFFRSSPYIIGFITAQLWHEKCRLWPNMGLTKRTSVVLSFASVGLLLFLTLGTSENNKRPCTFWESPHSTDCGSGWSRGKLAIFNSLMRPAWGLGLAIMSLLSFNGQMRCFFSSSVLNWTGWDPMARLSFSMYLLHPLIINIWVMGGASKFRYSHVSFLFAFAGIVAITVLVALGVGILVEWPVSKITKYLESNVLLPKHKETETDELEPLMNRKR